MRSPMVHGLDSFTLHKARKSSCIVGKKMGDDNPEKERLVALEKQVASMKSEFSEVASLLKQLLTKEEPLEKLKDAPFESEDGSVESESDGKSDNASKTSQQEGKSSFLNLKIDFKIEVPMYDDSVNVDKLDD
ncbi:hypothetical protein ACLB2K_050658 [Fragaria x ananassa]